MTNDISRPGTSVFRGALAALAFSSSLLAACGGDDDGAADDDAADDGTDDSTDGGDDPGDDLDAAPGPDGSTDRATGYVANPAGTIDLVEGFVGKQGTGAVAILRDAPDAPPAALLASAGGCEVWTRSLEPGQCDPPCEGVCVSDGECVPFPVPIDAGEIEVAGATEPLRFFPGQFGYSTDPKIAPEDLFADDAVIQVTAAGAAAPGFSLEASGVARLEADLDLDFDITLVLEDGVDRPIRWIAGTGGGQVQLALLVGHHGEPYEALLVCEAPDADGELVIPGDLVTQLPRSSTGLEQGASWIQRFTRDVVDGEGGPIQLQVSSRVIIPQIDHR